MPGDYLDPNPAPRSRVPLELSRYVAEVGREPGRLPDEHPDAWQWTYRGTPAERKDLAERVALEDATAPALIAGQEELF